MQIFVSQNGQQLGPFSWDQVQDQLNAGTLSATDYAWHEGLNEWIALSELGPPADSQTHTDDVAAGEAQVVAQAAAPSKLRAVFGFLWLIGVFLLPVVISSLILMEKSGPNDGPLFVILFPIYYLYTLFKVVGPLVFIVTLVFSCIGGFLVWPARQGPWWMRIPAYGLMALAALQLVGSSAFYVGYNFTGNRSWEKYRQAELAKPDSYYRDWQEVLVRKEVPDEQNFAMSPLWAPLNDLESEFSGYGEISLSQASGEKRKKASEKIKYAFPIPIYDRSLKKSEDINKGYVCLIIDSKNRSIEGDFRKRQVRSINNLYYSIYNLRPHQPQLDTRIKSQRVLAAFAKYNESFDELSEAARRPHFHFKIEVEKGLSTLLPHLAPLKTTCRMLSYRATLRIAAGDSSGALEDIKTILAISKGISSEPFIISHLVSIPIADFALQPLFEGLVTGLWNDAQLAQLEPTLNQFDWLKVFREGVIVDYASFNHARDMSFSGSSEQKNHYIDVFNTRVLKPCYSISGWVKRNQLNYNRDATEQAPSFIDYKQRHVRADKIKKSAPKLGLHYFFHQQVNPLYNFQQISKYSRIQVYFDLARVAVALERYRLKEMKYPEQLAPLEPVYMKTVPHDIMSGKAFRYIREQSSYKLYSVAWDQKDGKGQQASHYTKEGDWVWPAKISNPREWINVSPKVPPARSIAWTAGLDSKSIDRFYLGKNQLLLQQVFGRPDKTQGEWWGYANMNITSGGGEKYQEVWFGFANGVVQEVRLGK